jgi:NADH:ubiquinone oxidoreductase subunit D
MEFFERISGARMHTAMFRPNFFDFSLINSTFILDLSKFLLKSSRILNSTFLSLLNNRIFKTRLCNIGIISSAKVVSYSITGILARSAGFKDDLRLQKNFDYGVY